MPGASTWFPSYHSGTQTAVEGAQPGTQAIEDDDDFEVASERISIKCPITLLPMKHPVSSKKCPHSFEKEAILSMINASEIWEETPSNGRRGATNGPKAMKCPVCEVVSNHQPIPDAFCLNAYDDSYLRSLISTMIPSSFAKSNAFSPRRPRKTKSRQTKRTIGQRNQHSAGMKLLALQAHQYLPGSRVKQ